MAKSIENSIDFAAKRQVWQRMILKHHLPDAHCNAYMAKQPCCFAAQQSCAAKSYFAFRHHMTIITPFRAPANGDFCSSVAGICLRQTAPRLGSPLPRMAPPYGGAILGTVNFNVNHRSVKYRKHHFSLEPQRFQAFFYALHCGFRMFSSCFHNHFTTFRILCQPHLCDTYLSPGDAAVSKTLLMQTHVRI